MEQRTFLLQTGYLLHQRAYGERDAILELFCREHGRLGLFARGVRAGRSRRRGVLQPFSELLLSWRARGELGQLSDVEARGVPRLPSGKALLSGFYLNELLMRLLRRDDPHPRLYDSYGYALSRLAGGEAEAPTLRIFEKHLLAELGYGLLLEHDCGGTPIAAEQIYDYRLEQGPVPCAEGAARLSVHGDCLLALARERFGSPRQLKQSKLLLREALAVHLGERPLRSRELYLRRVQ